MHLNRIYTLLCLVVLATLLLLIWVTLNSGMGLYFILGQVLVVLTILLLIRLYQKTIKPIRTMISGVDLLNSQDFSTRLQHVKQKDIDHIVDLFNRLLQQLKNERLRVREKNEQLDILINASPMGVVILDLNCNISLINPSACSILGCKEQALRLEDIKSSLSIELLGLDRDASKVVYFNNGDIFKCTHSSFVASGFKHSFYLIERMTEELLFAERKAYEQVIRMIAHEVNNSMAGVSSAVDMAQSILKEESKDEELIELLGSSSSRCIALSRFISRFADVVKIPEPELHTVDLNRFVIDNSKLYESLTMGSDIKMIFDLCNDPVEIKLDISQFGQVLLNVIKNAVEAIPKEHRGEIVISTSSEPFSLMVSNDGEPITSEIQQNLFSPFYTTKPNGQGIGLMIAREVLIRHNLRYNLFTDSAGITRFIVHNKVEL